jgi:hypothetical protein
MGTSNSSGHKTYPESQSLKMGSGIGTDFGQNDRINKMGHGFPNPFDVHSVILSKICSVFLDDF